jgi:hypothetical protein
MGASERHLREWFSDDELELCPHCTRQAAVTTEAGAVACTECGLVELAAEHGPPHADT